MKLESEAPTTGMGYTKVRPLGVTLLIIIELVAGVVTVYSAALLFLVQWAVKPPDASPIGFYGTLGMISAISHLVIGLLAFILATGLWLGKRWAWWLTAVLSFAAIALAFLSLPTGIIGIAVNIIVLHYLWRPHVRAYFGLPPAKSSVKYADRDGKAKKKH